MRKAWYFGKPSVRLWNNKIKNLYQITIQNLNKAKQIVRDGLVALGPTHTPVEIPFQKADVILHNIAKNRFDIVCKDPQDEDRLVLDSSEIDLRNLDVNATEEAMKRELQTLLPDLSPDMFQSVVNPMFQALNVTRHIQAAYHYLTSIFQDNLTLWFRPVSTMQALLRNCPKAMDDRALKLLGVNIDAEAGNIYVQSKIPFELMIRDWCYPSGAPEHQNAENGWVFFLPVAAVVTEGIPYLMDDGDRLQNICVRLQTMTESDAQNFWLETSTSHTHHGLGFVMPPKNTKASNHKSPITVCCSAENG